MSELPPLLRDQRKVDAEHLALLAILHFVGAGLALVGLLFLLMHYAMFRAFFDEPTLWEQFKQPPPPAAAITMFKWVYLIGGVWFVGSGVVNAMSGLFIRARKHRMFSVVVAAINCLHMPLGTLLGVFTILVLMRDSVREAYDHIG